MRTRLTTPLFALGALSLALTEGCAAQRLVAPDTPPILTEPADLTGVKLAVRSFTATNQSESDVKERGRAKLEQAFLQYLADSASFGLVVGPSMTPPKDAVEVDVLVKVEEDANRTIIFDGIFFYPFCGTFPFTPLWGNATVDASITFRRDPEDGVDERPIAVEIVAPYSVIFYSWYRTGPIEDAFRRAHDAAFRQLTQELVSRLARRERKRAAEALARTLPKETVATSTTVPSATDAPAKAIAAGERPDDRTREAEAEHAKVEKELLSLGSALLPEAKGTGVERAKLGLDLGAREQVHLQPEGVNIIFEPIHRPRDEGFFGRYVASLGGLEGSVTGGVASVESKARTSAGFVELLGSGNARSHGYRVSLYQPPDRTGFFFPPVLGFLSQTIEIDGFRQDVPIADVAGAETIGARVTDPTTGAPVDLSDPIAYMLKLQSSYIGQGIGLNMVIGTEDVQLFGTVKGAINLLEVRHMNVDVNTSHVSGTTIAAFQSGSVGAQLGLAIPPLHLAIRGAVQMEWFMEFEYPLITDAQGVARPPEFQASTRYDPVDKVYVRERVFVEGASLRTVDWMLSVVALF